MSAPLPELSPSLQQKMDQFHSTCNEVLDRYLEGFERDMNRHAVKHGPMPEERAVFDITRILTRQVETGELPQNVAMGILSMAIVRGIARKKQGRG